MLKFIFFVLVISLFTIYFSDTISDTTIIVTTASMAIVSALELILQVILVPFSTMLTFYYLKIALYIGVLFFVVSYILKWITGHHLTLEEETNEDYNEYYKNLKTKEWEARNIYLFNSDDKELRKK